jgi:hypothetical protein
MRKGRETVITGESDILRTNWYIKGDMLTTNKFNNAVISTESATDAGVARYGLAYRDNGLMSYYKHV